MPRQPVLCYVDAPWAYFTTAPLSDQSGDGWYRPHYEHNAGDPYEYTAADRKRGRAPWTITKIAWDGDAWEPACDGHTNSPYSVEQINAGLVPWLHTPRWYAGPPAVIPAGTTLRRFCKLIRATGGNVYFPKEKHGGRMLNGRTHNGQIDWEKTNG